MPVKLPGEFYLDDDVVKISKALLGKKIVTSLDGGITSGLITETEAYAGITDKASHAWNGRRTNRTETMYCHGGTAYVYLCYGIHSLFNIVTNKKDIPHAVLIRAVKPVDGIDIILKRRNKSALYDGICTGPGSMSQGLGITTLQNGTDLCGNTIWLEETGIKIRKKDIITGTRIGVDYAGEDALLPYRFRIVI